MLILICDAFDPSLPERLVRFGESTSDHDRLAEAEVALVRSKTKCTADWMGGAPKLKLIVRGGVGIDNIDLDTARSRGIEVRNTPQASSIAVAELAFALMLAVPNHIVRGHNGMASGEWLKKELKRTELHGKTLGLIGIGRIATEVARRARAFGMDVVAFDRYVEQSEYAVMQDLDTVLATSDYISLHVPATDETRGMISSETIAKMKDGAVLVNTARGACVVEEDLAAALRDGRLGAYATDVYNSDPPDPSSPILSAPNVLMTPHIGASSKENLLRIGDVIVEILEEYTAKSGS